jgi:long-chain fatty acid transport protein
LGDTQVQAGLQGLYGNVKFSQNGSAPQGGGNGGTSVGALPGASFFYSQKLDDNVAVGFGTLSYFGLAEQYDANWVGRYYIQEGKLLGTSFVPAISIKVNDWLAVGAGLNAMYGYLNAEAAINNTKLIPGDGQLKIEDEKWGFGGIFGVILSPREGTRFGVTYISPVKLNFSDTPEYRNAPILNALPIAHQNLGLGVTVPQSVMFGVYQDLNEKWALMADVGWQNWSQFSYVNASFNGASVTQTIHFNDTWHGAIGAKYKYNEKWAFTGGFAYDTSAVSDANRTVILPVGEAYRFGLGTDWQMSKSVTLNVSYELLWAGDMSVNQSGPVRGTVNGSYDSVWFSFLTANLTWRF